MSVYPHAARRARRLSTTSRVRRGATLLTQRVARLRGTRRPSATILRSSSRRPRAQCRPRASPSRGGHGAPGLREEQIAAAEPVGVDQALGPLAIEPAGAAEQRLAPCARDLGEQLERLAARRARAGARRAGPKRTIWQRESTVAGTARTRGRIRMITGRGGGSSSVLRNACGRLARHPLGVVEDEHLAARHARGGARPGARARGWRRCGSARAPRGFARAASARSRAGRDAALATSAHAGHPRSVVSTGPLAQQRLANASAAAVRPAPTGPTKAYA